MGKKHAQPKTKPKERRCMFVRQVIGADDVGRSHLTTSEGTRIPVNKITAEDVGKVVYFNLGR